MKHGIIQRVMVPVAMVLGMLGAGNAHAEKLEVDHRIYPPLKAALDNPNDNTVYFDSSRSGRLFDRILVAGNSAEHDWTEALELVVTRRDARARTPAEWLSRFRPGKESVCPAAVSLLAQDDASVTFALTAPDCSAGPPLTGLYRVFYGRKSVYLIGAKYKGAMTTTQREQWLALLASARLAG